MFRSLFIGFLILSAITSRNAGIQINQITDLSPDILLQLFNADFSSYDGQTELSETDAALLVSAHKDVSASIEHTKTRQKELPFWHAPAIYAFTTVLCFTVPIFLKQKYCSDIYLGITDLSPPYCPECS